MGKNLSCLLCPEVNGKDSRLYKDMLKKNKLERPLANYIYASYVASNMADMMDQAGFQRNSQGQHESKDVLAFIDYHTMQQEFASFSKIEEQEGFVDSNGIRIDYDNAKDALEKADAFNDSHKGLVATVVQHGDVYNIIAAEKNSRTHMRGDAIKEKLKIWDVYKQAFNAIGVDIDNMPQEIASIFNAGNTGLAQSLKNLQNLDIRNMYRKDALALFYSNPNSPLVQRLLGQSGSLEAAAQAIDDVNHGINNISSHDKQLLVRAIKDCQKFQGLDLDAMKAQASHMSQQISRNSNEETIQQELNALNKKYGIDINEIHRTSEEINTLSEAAADAAFAIQRQIRELEKEKGDIKEGRRLEGILNQLMKELANKKYYSGMLNFLGEASNAIQQIDAMLQAAPQTGTELEKAMAMAKILQNIKAIKDQYYAVISALTNKNLTIDESIDQQDIDSLRNTAKSIQDYFDSKEKVLKNLAEETMVSIMSQVVGDFAPNGQSMINAIRMAAADSSFFDAWLYSMGRASNPLVAGMGSIIRNAQDSRDQELNAISLRVRRATDRLYKSGSNSEFMYEDDGHIISDIDWVTYKNARHLAIKGFQQQGLKGWDMTQAIQNWEEANTEDRVVDNTNGRTERVPNAYYRKEFPDLTPAQQEYYDTMMQIKGEIGSMMPEYARHQYLPPQLRRNMLDALGHSRSFGDVAKAVRNKMENLWSIREDDERFNMNGIIDGDEYQIMEGSYDNTPLRQIPIFFVKPLSDQDELLKDFSAGLQALAGTAINYDAMSNIAQVVEFMGDFIKGQTPRENTGQADMVGNKMLRAFKDLRKFGKNTNTSQLIDGFIGWHIYGQKFKLSKWEEKYPWLLKMGTNLIGYTSFKGLATNFKGALANYLTGEYQMLIEAGAGEFYGLKDYLWAHTKLFGGAGAGGEIMELLTNNVNHKGVLLGQLFDPLQENFSSGSHQRYHKSIFRQLVSRDLSFLGYGAGEYLIHYVNMYGVLHNTKVKFNGKIINLYDAFEVASKQDGNSELVLKQGVTTLAGDAIDQAYLDRMRKKIRGVNQSTHGAMNEEDKGLIHQRLWGRMVMNFRQWMVEHYSRRFRGRHYDYTFNQEREGYWVSFFKLFGNTKEAYEDDGFGKAMGMFLKDLWTFSIRASSQWSNLDEMQRYNVKRVHTEMLMFMSLLSLEFALGDPDKHKREFWRRFWMYETKRLILDAEASMPVPQMVSSLLTTINSPMASVNTLNSILYLFYGLTNGDITEEIKSGDHKGENKYWRNVKKYVLPFYKDYEQLQKLDTDESIFQVFENKPSNK